MNPLVTNGITKFVTRGDLADRSIIVELYRLTDKQRLTVHSIRSRWAEAHPHILGALFDGMSAALANEYLSLPMNLPRMADSAEFVTLCEHDKTGPDRPPFSEALARNQGVVTSILVDSDAIAKAVVDLIAIRNGAAWEGSAKELLKTLPRPLSGWFPETPQALANALKRAANPLRQSRYKVHIEFGVDRRSKGGGQDDLTITRLDGGASPDRDDVSADQEPQQVSMRSRADTEQEHARCRHVEPAGNGAVRGSAGAERLFAGDRAR